MTNFCTFNTNYAGKCGTPVLDFPNLTICKRHRNKPQREPREKIGNYSGVSKLRISEGYKK